MRIQMAPARRGGGGERSNSGGSTYVIQDFLLVPVTQTQHDGYAPVPPFYDDL